MKELQAILENDVLNDSTKNAISEAFKEMKAEAVNEAKKEMEVEYAEKMVKEKKELAAKLPELVAESVAEEMKNFKDEIEHFKNLEVHYAKRLQDFKESYNKRMAEKVVKLVEGVVKEDITELKESIVEAKRNIAGQRIFEAIIEYTNEFGISEDHKALKERIDTTTQSLEEAKKEVEELKRDKVMSGLLSGLKGSKREVMKSILEGVKTENLEKRYEETIDRVLGEEKKPEGKEIVNENVEGSETDLQYLEEIDTLVGNRKK